MGVNEYEVDDEAPIDILLIDGTVADRQIADLRKLRERRDNPKVSETRGALKTAAEGEANMMGPILDCVRAYATLGEICDTLRSVYGTYAEPDV